MVLAVLLCLPLSPASAQLVGFWDFAFYCRFLTGLGVGGEFSISVWLMTR